MTITTKLTPCRFTFDETPAFDGYSHGSQWNGWDNVAVTRSTLEHIARYFTDEGDSDTALELMDITPMEDGLFSLGWGYTTQLVKRTRYVVRDIATQGCDFLLWGDDDPAAAQETLRSAICNGIEAELITMPADDMDPHTRHLIEGN